MAAPRRVLVVGGGIGGVAAATALAQRGRDVLMIEKQPAFTAQGVGLGQPANSLRVLDTLGVLPQVLDAGFEYDCMRYFDSDRTLIVEHKFLLGGRGVPAVCALSRADLHEILFSAARRASVETKLGTTAIEMHQTPDQVQVTFSDGTHDAFDLVVGFDGIRSTTRNFAFGPLFEPAPSGFGAWRIQVSRPPEVDAMEFYQSIGSKTGAIPLNHDVMYLFHIRPEEPGRYFSPADNAQNLRERLQGYGDYIGEVRDGLTEQSEIVYSPLELSMLPPNWHNGRIVLGGDAAHTFPPHLTEGAGMALEDGYILADEVSQNRPIEESLRAYTKRRYPRCAFVYSFSLQMLYAEQAIRTPDQLDEARRELRANASPRIAAADRILNADVLSRMEVVA